MQGWVKFYRAIRQDPVFNHFQMFRLWVICLTEAAHQPIEIQVGNQRVKLEPGQFVTGRFELQDMYNSGLKRDERVSDKTVWRWLEKFQTYGVLSIKSTNKFSIVSWVDWASQQSGDHQVVQQMSNRCPSDDQEVTKGSPPNDQQVSTNKNEENLENGKNRMQRDSSRPKRQKRVYAEDDRYRRIAARFLERIHAWHPEYAFRGNWDTWADDFRKLYEIDKVTDDQLGQVIEFATTDPFWRKNVLSPAKLREKWPQLAAAMKSDGRKATGSPPPAPPGSYGASAQGRFERGMSKGTEGV